MHSAVPPKSRQIGAQGLEFGVQLRHHHVHGVFGTSTRSFSRRTIQAAKFRDVPLCCKDQLPTFGAFRVPPCPEGTPISPYLPALFGGYW